MNNTIYEELYIETNITQNEKINVKNENEKKQIKENYIQYLIAKMNVNNQIKLYEEFMYSF
jgi:hypothetical protein